MHHIWVYLAETPLLWLTLTVVVYYGATLLHQWAGGAALLNPVLVAVVVLVSLLLFTGTPYSTYFDGAQFVHFLLGPATVALALPLYHAASRLRQMLLPLLAALLVGASVSVLSAAGLGWLLGLSPEALRSLLPKSVTTPIAMGISEQVGGLPPLTAVFVILTGMCGAMTAHWLLRRAHVDDPATQGFAIGLAAHGIGTARAFQLHPEAGAFAGLAMGLNGAASALLVPLLVHLLRL
ncbi:MAG: LrgB family protein [Chloroflexaceae bacterium]|jgi:predicted murein hydrolase (TIGR00659 family)|nr:LrgB family protein [Chloroflexaceae bacterium]